jgi:hypothetical protein
VYFSFFWQPVIKNGVKRKDLFLLVPYFPNLYVSVLATKAQGAKSRRHSSRNRTITCDMSDIPDVIETPPLSISMVFYHQ